MKSSNDMKRICLFLVAVAVAMAAVGQVDSVQIIRGRVTCGKQVVPYAILQVQGTSVGTLCNDMGEYELRLPSRSEEGWVEVRSMGYGRVVCSVSKLLKNGHIKLQKQSVELREVRIQSYRDGRKLLMAAVERIKANYHQRRSYPTFFYRDWRAIDGELYLFDEAVMLVNRAPYSAYASKRGFAFSSEAREMKSNIKSLLRHRMLVCDAGLLGSKISNPQGVAEKMEYADNEYFFDPVETPQASYLLASRMLKQHDFEPVQEFDDNGEVYYLVRSVGPNRNKRNAAHYQYIIRKTDLAIVSISSVQRTIQSQAPKDEWVNASFNRMTIECDSSMWCYEQREGRYTLSRYYNLKTYRLHSSRSDLGGAQQCYQESRDWVLTDFSLATPQALTDTLVVQPTAIATAFGHSSFESDFWGHYNTVAIDTLPLRLLKEKFRIP